MKTLSNQNRRIDEIDFLRGICIFLMIIEHIGYFIYRYVYLCEFEFIDYSGSLYAFSKWCNYVVNYSAFEDGVRICVLMLFFIISGISTTFSKNNIKRCLELYLFACIMVAVDILTNRFIKYPVVLSYGIFFAYALFILFYCCFGKLPNKIYYCLCGAVLAICVVVMIKVPEFSVSPFQWSGLSNKWGLQWRDDFDMFPALVFFCLGTVLGKTIYSSKKSLIGDCLSEERMFKFLGKYSLQVYIGHIIALPLIFVIIAVIGNP